jgi:serralysin
LNDAWSTSVMSYFDQQENSWFSNQGFSRDFAVTPMGADILAMQTLYGLSTTTRTGDTIYGYGSNAGGVYDATLYPKVAYTIFDNGGTDTLNFSGSAANQSINLNAETFSNVNGETGNLYIARGIVIENANTGSGNDTVIQNSANNAINGGAGNDTISYETATTGVRVNLSLTTAQNTGGAGIDTLSGFENLIGSAYADTLIGGSATVSISGGAGDDLIDAGIANPTSRLSLFGGDGDDTFMLGVGTGPFAIDGGSGYNIVDGSHAFAGLLLSTNYMPPGGVDSLVNIQKIIGSNFDDKLIAPFAGDILIGGAGNDVLTG